MIGPEAYATLPKGRCWLLMFLVSKYNGACWSLWSSGRQRQENRRSGRCWVTFHGEVHDAPEIGSIFDEDDDDADDLQVEQAFLVTAEQAKEILLIARHMRDRDQWNTAAESYATRVLGVRLPHINIPEGI